LSRSIVFGLAVRLTVGGMGQRSEQDDVRQDAARLLPLARQLREAATRAGRLDVVAKADEVIALVVANDPVDDDDQKPGHDDKSNTVLKILDGLGF
jgi:hypothetical protein